MNEKKITAYKGFDKDFKCRGFQYEVGKDYKMDGDIQCCKRGFHACESPFEVFDYYDMLSSRFAVVELSGTIDKEKKSTKICSSNIKIKAELNIADIVKLGIEWIKDITLSPKAGGDIGLNDNSGDSALIGSSDDYAKIGSSGYAKIGSSGDYAKIGSSGYAKIGSSGDFAQIGSSGDFAQIGSSGDYAKIGSSGTFAQIGSSGDYAKIGSSGDYAKIGSSGYAKIGSSGDFAQIGSSGTFAQIGSSGDFAQINSTGEHSVIMAAGYNSIVKASLGSWITLAEWEINDDSNSIPICVKTEKVDGRRIKADTYYRLVNGEFKEVED